MKLEIYYDYLCEFCERGHRVWVQVLPRFPEITPVWCPCEAHPREYEPNYGAHSDLAAQGLYYVAEHGKDAAAYNAALFAAAWQRGESLEDTAVLARYAADAGCDTAAFADALRSGAYAPQVRAANERAWGALALPAVPSCVFEDGRRLEALPMVGVTQSRLEAFLQGTV